MPSDTRSGVRSQPVCWKTNVDGRARSNRVQKLRMLLDGTKVSDSSGGSGWWLASDGRWYPPYARPAQTRPSPLLPTVSGPPRLRRPRLWPVTTTLIVGAVCAFGGLMLFAVVGFAGFGDQAYRAPVAVALECHVDDYYVYQHVGSQVSSPDVSHSHYGFPTLKPFEVQVRGPDGVSVATFATDSSDTITRGSWTYLNTVGFHAGTPGNYEVRIAAVSPSGVIVAPSVGSQYVRAVPWLILVGLGALVGVTSLVYLVRRGRERRLPRYEPGPPNPWVTPTNITQ